MPILHVKLISFLLVILFLLCSIFDFLKIVVVFLSRGLVHHIKPIWCDCWWWTQHILLLGKLDLVLLHCRLLLSVRDHILKQALLERCESILLHSVDKLPRCHIHIYLLKVDCVVSHTRRLLLHGIIGWNRLCALLLLHILHHVHLLILLKLLVHSLLFRHDSYLWVGWGIGDSR